MKPWEQPSKTIDPNGTYIVFVASPDARASQNRILIHDANFVCLDNRKQNTGVRREILSEWLLATEETECLGTAEIAWFEDITKGKEVPIESKTMTSLFVGLQSLLQNRDFEMVDWVLENADPEKMAPEAMVGLLRYSFVAREHLGNWSIFLDAVSEELALRKMDNNHLLRGLYAGGSQQTIRSTF